MSGRGRVRFELLLGQVLDALPSPPISVADAGGGTGQLAVPLARLGYSVTVVDTSAAMLATCAQRAAAEDPALASRIATVQADVVEMTALLGPASQDAALCHEVVTCVDDPGAVLGALAAVLRPGGVLSLTFANRDWLVLRAARRGDYPGALRLLEDAGGSSAPHAPARRAATAAELDAHLVEAGFEVAAVYGVNVFAEGRDDDLDAAALEALLALEQRVAGREPYRSGAQVVHLVAHRAAGSSSQVRP
ncbi:MAG TPA: methyltransferase domain-containing protein [Actinomycetes bacterium]|jgi:SAM-dependent methyltransferase|nr:methyltransferase domain-containing protein [Actinomycetes bacterium]